MTELEKCEIAKVCGYTYNPITGEIKGRYGKVINTKSEKGYIQLRIFGAEKRFKLWGHRLGWFLHYGEIPKNYIDHIDGDRANNKIDNLRDVTHQQNCMNRTKAKGYFRRKFQSCITVNKKQIYLGYFNTEEEAHNAYLEAKKIYHVIITE